MKKKTGKKVVVYGGSFDPPHRGHISLIKAALEQLSPEILYIVPSFRSPGKALPGASFRDRAAMLKAALSSAGIRDRVRVHPYEHARGKTTYTWQTLEFFRGKYPGAELYFLMGSDCLGSFHLWKKYRRILSMAGLAVGIRKGAPLKNPEETPYFLLKGIFPAAASNALRREFLFGSGTAGLAQGARERVLSRGLYFSGLRRKLAGMMSPARLRHSLGTAALAAELADKYGADAEKAALAALLHDAAREFSARRLRALAGGSGSPDLLHPSAGAVLAAGRFGVRDGEVLGAIKAHLLGKAAPGLLEKIVFVADLAERGRGFKEAGALRKKAFEDLDAAYTAAQFVKLGQAFARGRRIRPESVKIWNELLKKRG